MGVSFADLHVLIVDDDAFTRSIVADVLKTMGFRRVRESVDGEAAFDACRQTPPDIVILDLAMPSDGVSLLRRLRTAPDSPDREVAVIAMTAFTDRRRIELLRDAGASEIMAKPLSVSSIQSRLVAVIDRPRPFVMARDYVGPDRRRHANVQRGMLRRAADFETDTYEVA